MSISPVLKTKKGFFLAWPFHYMLITLTISPVHPSDPSTPSFQSILLIIPTNHLPNNPSRLFHQSVPLVNLPNISLQSISPIHHSNPSLCSSFFLSLVHHPSSFLPPSLTQSVCLSLPPFLHPFVHLSLHPSFSFHPFLPPFQSPPSMLPPFHAPFIHPPLPTPSLPPPSLFSAPKPISPSLFTLIISPTWPPGIGGLGQHKRLGPPIPASSLWGTLCLLGEDI